MKIVHLIARCLGAADVVDAINLTHKMGLEVAVRGGGHNVAGRATIDGGVMIDLSPMKGIHVDPKGRTARVQGGVTWAELNRETQLHGLAVTGGVVSSTGIAASGETRAVSFGLGAGRKDPAQGRAGYPRLFRGARRGAAQEPRRGLPAPAAVSGRLSTQRRAYRPDAKLNLSGAPQTAAPESEIKPLPIRPQYCD